MWDTLVDWIKWAFGWVVGLIADFAEWAAGLIFALLPESAQMEWEWIGPYAYSLNKWLPISEMFTLLFALWTFQVGFIVAKYIWKAIPGTG